MKKRTYINWLAIVLGAILLNPTLAMTSDKTKYYINGTEVAKKKFDRKLKSLKETAGWHCTETTTGGSTGYDCKDFWGRKYHYECETDIDRNECHIIRMGKNKRNDPLYL